MANEAAEEGLGALTQMEQQGDEAASSSLTRYRAYVKLGYVGSNLARLAETELVRRAGYSLEARWCTTRGGTVAAGRDLYRAAQSVLDKPTAGAWTARYAACAEAQAAIVAACCATNVMPHELPRSVANPDMPEVADLILTRSAAGRGASDVAPVLSVSHQLLGLSREREMARERAEAAERAARVPGERAPRRKRKRVEVRAVVLPPASNGTAEDAQLVRGGLFSMAANIYGTIRVPAATGGAAAAAAAAAAPAPLLRRRSSQSVAPSAAAAAAAASAASDDDGDSEPPAKRARAVDVAVGSRYE
jgi:hypothetical protein